MELELTTIQYMVHYLAEVLNISVVEINEKWSTAQVLVSYAYYSNKQAKENYKMWIETNAENRKGDPPLKQIVFFKNHQEYREEMEEWQMNAYR